jgi:HEAT repeat protein
METKSFVRQWVKWWNVLAIIAATLVVLVAYAYSQSTQAPTEGQLIKTVKESSGEPKNDAIQKLGTLKSTKSVDALAEVMQKEPAVETRVNGAIALGKIGDQRSAEELAMAMKSDPSLAVQINAARALGMINNPSVSQELVGGASRQNPSELRSESVRSLGAVHTPEARETIMRATADEDPEVRLAAVDAISREHDSNVARAGLVLTQDKDPRVAAQAATMFGELRDKEAEKPLIENLMNSPVMDVRAKSAFALGRIGSPEGLDVLAKALSNRNEQFEVKFASVEALGMIGGPKASTTLLQILNGEDKMLQVPATIVASQLQLPESEGRVKALLGDADPQIRSSAIIAMGLWPSQYASALLSAALNERETPENRIAALTSLDALPPQQTPEDVITQIEKFLNPKVRLELQVAAIQYLADRTSPGVKAALEEFARTPKLDPVVQDTLKNVLGK